MHICFWQPAIHDLIWVETTSYRNSMTQFEKQTWISSTASPVRVGCPPASGTKFFALWHYKWIIKVIAKCNKLDVSFFQEFAQLIKSITMIHNIHCANYTELGPKGIFFILKLYLIKYDKTIKFWPTPLYKLLQTGPTFLRRCYQTAVCWKNNSLPDANRLWVKLRIR